MAARYLDPTNDVAFKKIFSDKDRLKDFLNAILRLPEGQKITHIDFIAQEELPEWGLGRRSIFDLKCVDQENKTYVVEMQNRPEDAFLNRIQCYAAHSYSSQAKKGTNHDTLMPVIIVAITNRTLFEDREVECINYHWNVESKTKKRFLFALSYVFVELPKFKKSAVEIQSTEDEWLYFFSNWHHALKPPETTTDPLVLEAYETIEQFNWSEAEYDAYFRARLAAEAEELVVTNSYEEGVAKEKEEIARRMLSKGMDVKTVSDMTGLSIANVESLLKESSPAR